MNNPASDPEAPPPEASSRPKAARPVEANLLQLLSGLGAQTLVHLGLMADPLSGKAAPNLPQAKYTIDLLAVLEEKTQGNRTEEEERYLQAMLTQLRMAYVELASRPPEPPQAPEGREGEAPAPPPPAGTPT
ncbi:MAG: DUF1844 domain-containing protein [Planctomycetota bacterium]